MRVLLTADYFDPNNHGGAGRVVLELATGLLRHGVQVQVLSGADEYQHRYLEMGDAGVIEWSSFPYRRQGARGLGFLLAVRRGVQRACERFDAAADVVIHNQPLTAEYFPDRRIPSFYIFHSPWPVEYLVERFGRSDLLATADLSVGARLQIGARRKIERRAVHRASGIVTLSETMRTMVTDIHHVDPESVNVLPGGADLEQFHVAQESQRQQSRSCFGVDPEELLLVSVRRLVPRTGIDLLVEAVAAVEAEHPIKLLVGGTGPCLEDVRSQAEALSLPVEFLGYVSDEDLVSLYQCADLAVVPTRALEGFGLATLEALACGTPVVATPVGGSVEILEQFDPRLLASEVSAVGLADRLRYWAQERTQLAALRGGCRPFVESHYSWQNMAAGVHEMLESVFVA